MKQTLSIIILSLYSLNAVATEAPSAGSAGSSCSWKLANHAKVSAQVTGTISSKVYTRAASTARWWRNEKVPADTARAQKDLAQLEENLIHDDRLDQAVHQTKRHIEAVEFSFMIIKNHLQPMRKIFKSMIAELQKKKDANLKADEVAKLEDAFLGVSENYESTRSYGHLSKEGRAVNSIRTLETLFTSDAKAEIPRAKVISLLNFVDKFLESQEIDYAADIGRHVTTYEMLKGYMDSSYEDRYLAYSLRTENVDEIAMPTAGGLALPFPAGLESTAAAADTTPVPSVDGTSKEALLASRKAAWEKNMAHLKNKVGWDAELKDRFPELADAPSPKLEDILRYYNENPTARLAHNRGAAFREARITFLTQLVDLTLVGSVVRPLVGSLMSGPGKLRRTLNAVKEWSNKAQKALILKDIQELVESGESTIEKAANLANYASDPRIGPYMLQLFASNADLMSRIVWREIHDYTKQDATYYPDLRKMMDTAQGLADKDGVPVAIQTSYWSPSQTASVVVWLLGIGYYQFYGDEDEELDNKVRESFWQEMKDLFGIEPDPQPTDGVSPEVKPDTLDPAAAPAADAPVANPAGEIAAPAPAPQEQPAPQIPQ